MRNKKKVNPLTIIGAVLRVLFTISYVPYFYNLYEKVKDKKKSKVSLTEKLFKVS